MLAWLVPDGRPMFRSIFATFLPHREIEIIVEKMPSTSKGKQTDCYHSLFFLPHFLQAAAGECCLLLSKEKVTKENQSPEWRGQRKPKTPILFFGKFVEIYISNVFKDYVLGLVATNIHFFHWSALITFWNRKTF